MKNRSIGIIVSLIILTLVVGCSWWNPLASKPESNRNTAAKDNKATPAATEKPLEDKAIDTAVGEEKIGVPECDELVESLVAQSESPDDNYVTKAARGYALSKMRESIKKSIEENKNDKEQLAKDCKEFKGQLDKYKAEEEKKTQ